MAWATPELAGADLAWNRKRRLAEEAAEEEEDGWKCDEEEYEEAAEQESTVSRQSGCRRRARRLGLAMSALRGQGEVSAGPFSAKPMRRRKDVKPSGALYCCSYYILLIVCSRCTAG